MKDEGNVRNSTSTGIPLGVRFFTQAGGGYGGPLVAAQSTVNGVPRNATTRLVLMILEPFFVGDGSLRASVGKALGLNVEEAVSTSLINSHIFSLSGGANLPKSVSTRPLYCVCFDALFPSVSNLPYSCMCCTSQRYSPHSCNSPNTSPRHFQPVFIYPPRLPAGDEAA